MKELAKKYFKSQKYKKDNELFCQYSFFISTSNYSKKRSSFLHNTRLITLAEFTKPTSGIENRMNVATNVLSIPTSVMYELSVAKTVTN